MQSPFDPVEALKRIEAWMARYHPDRSPLFRPGADANALSRLEAKLGTSLPSDIRLIYTTHDGQPERAPSLYLNQRWLPLDLVSVAWEDLCRRYHRAIPARVENGCDASILKETGWSESWFPLFGSWRGDHYCIELRPEPSDRYGQIIWFLYDRPERSVVAQSITQLLSRVANGVESGVWRLDVGLDGLSD